MLRPATVTAVSRGPRLALALRVLPLLALFACGPSPSDRLPPIIIVDVDTLRADHLGCYGHPRPTSPNLDRFAAEAARFEWAFAQGPATPQSQSSILTGLYPSTHGRLYNLSKISGAVTTLAEALKAHGYATAAFVDGGLMAAGFGLEQGFDLYDDDAGRLFTIGPKAEEWLTAEAPDSGPFLLLIHTYDVHSPYEETPEPYRSMFLGDLELPSVAFRHDVTGVVSRVFDTRHAAVPDTLTADEVAYTKALYDGGIRHVDAWFGDFVAFLQRLGLYDRAVLVVISDHGEEFQEHGSFLHEQVYATVTRIPLLIRFPGGRYRGIYSQAVESIDLAPTLLELVGAPLYQPLQGRSLLPLLRGRTLKPRPAISESPYGGRHVAVTDEHLRLVVTDDLQQPRQLELFRYRQDPLEQRDLADARPAAGRRLLRVTEAWQALVAQDPFSADPADDLDPATYEQLRALGYVQ